MGNLAPHGASWMQSQLSHFRVLLSGITHMTFEKKDKKTRLFSKAELKD